MNVLKALQSKGSEVSVTTLDNGLTVVIKPFPQLESITAFFGVRYGNINFPESDPRAPGAHFLEHMLFRGTATRTSDDIHGQLDNAAAHNAYTSAEQTGYFVKFHRNDIDGTLDLLSDIIKNSTIRQEDIAIEAVPILNEYLTKLARTDIGVNRALFANLFSGHNAATLDRLHNEADVKKVTREMLMEVYKGQYTPDNSTLVLYGAVSRRDGLKLAGRYFGDMRGNHVDLDLVPASMDVKGCDVTVNLPTSNGQAIIEMGLPVPSFRRESDEKERIAAEVLADVLSVRLFRELRTHRGLVYVTGASTLIGRSEGLFSVIAKTKVENIGEVDDLIRKELASVARGEITEKEVQEKKVKGSQDALVKREDTLESAMETANYAVLSDKPFFVQHYPDAVMSLTPDDVIGVAAKYIDLSKLVTVTGVPSK